VYFPLQDANLLPTFHTVGLYRFGHILPNRILMASVTYEILLGVLSAMYLIVAAFANRVLLQRLDKAHSTAIHTVGRTTALTRGSSHAWLPSSIYGASLPSDLSLLSDNKLRDASGSEDRVAPTGFCATLCHGEAHGFRQLQSWFLVHMIVSLLVESITLLTLAILPTHVAMDTFTQDVLTAPSAISFFSLYGLLFVVLLWLTHFAASLQRALGYYARRWLMFFYSVSIVYTIGLILQRKGYGSKPIVEYVSAGLAAIATVVYLAAAWHYTRKVQLHGEAMAQSARKMRVVCILVAFSMAMRAWLFFPDVQSLLNDNLQSYALCILEAWMLVPYFASQWLLHRRMG